ncbi:MAG: hypothetical protein M1840_006406 [Geoglossum simile]|nr:MAG: hypothetical protein M1840_006406 [Geoglossum simile]
MVLPEATSAIPPDDNDMQTGGEAGLSEISEDVADSVNVALGSDSESLESIDRPNKYRGPPSTWRSWTEAERQLAASLDKERATDLAIHLYNSHALKRRLWRPRGEGASTAQDWANRESWLLPQGHLSSEGASDGQDAFHPQKGWTAWPMEPELVPTEAEGVLQPGTHEDNWGHQYGETATGPSPSEVLEDCIFSRILYTAKRKYQERIRDPTQTGYEAESGSSPCSSLHTASPSSTKGGDGPMTDDPTAIGHKRRDRANSEGSEDHSSFPYSGLVPLADDEKAHTLLRPIARHLMSRLDSLLIGLHYARESHLSPDKDDLGRAQEDELPNLERKPPSGKPPISESHTSRTRGRGRPPKNPQAHATSASSSTQNGNRAINPNLCPEDQKKRVGRPRKYPKGFEKSQADYYKQRRLAENLKLKTSPLLDLSEDDSASDYAAESESEGSSQRSSGTSGSPPHSTRNRTAGDLETRTGSRAKKRGQLGLMDWSDVLGIASMVGWDPEAVSRAAARCSTLFGEGIRFRTLDEEETFLGDGGVVEYRPNMILHPANASTRPSECKSQREREYPLYIQERINSVRLEGAKLKAQWSPVEDELLCGLVSIQPLAWREIAAHFPDRSAIACQSRWHRLMAESESAEQQLEPQTRSGGRSDHRYTIDPEEYHMVGGVHNDGFLEPIKARGGWRGTDQVKRKRRWKAKLDMGESG